MEMYNWAQDKVEEITGMTKEQRESQACQRRLEQMEKKRAKDKARAAKTSVKEQGK